MDQHMRRYGPIPLNGGRGQLQQGPPKERRNDIWVGRNFDGRKDCMSRKEKEWLVNIQKQQLQGSGNPMDDDYYCMVVVSNLYKFDDLTIGLILLVFVLVDEAFKSVQRRRRQHLCPRFVRERLRRYQALYIQSTCICRIAWKVAFRSGCFMFESSLSAIFSGRL